jgi:hypothetical protein
MVIALNPSIHQFDSAGPFVRQLPSASRDNYRQTTEDDFRILDTLMDDHLFLSTHLRKGEMERREAV